MVVVGLYSGQQCPTCGGRFVGVKSDEYGAHLDWHFKLKRREKANKIPTRKWMFPAEVKILAAELVYCSIGVLCK